MANSSMWENFKAELLEEISIDQAGRFVIDDIWGLQEKHNGHRRIVVKEGTTAWMTNRSGVRRSLPGPIAMVLRRIPFDFVLDGEMLDEKLGNVYKAFDLLSLNGLNILGLPYRERLALLTQHFTGVHSLIHVVETAFTKEEKMALIAKLDAECAEGCVFKKLDAKYSQGRANVHKKLKFVKTLSAIVGDRSLEKDGRIKDGVDLLLYDEKGVLIRISGCSLIGRQKVAKGDVVEVRFLYSTPERHIVQPVMIMKRDDVPPSECTVDQLRLNKNWR
jgi:bifunctional non-homologous end joining protein LigD